MIRSHFALSASLIFVSTDVSTWKSVLRKLATVKSGTIISMCESKCISTTRPAVSMSSISSASIVGLPLSSAGKASRIPAAPSMPKTRPEIDTHFVPSPPPEGAVFIVIFAVAALALLAGAWAFLCFLWSL